MDIRTQPLAAPPVAIHRADYVPPSWTVPDIALDFDLDPVRTQVTGRLSVVRQGAGPLRLDGDALVAETVTVDGTPAEWAMEGGQLVIDLVGDAHVVEISVTIAPEANTQLMGLYASDGLLCTQCEAEGFRRIMFFPDRPDVLARYSVRMTADRARYPVLLSNGDHVGSGTLPDGRHYAEWRDPFPKPSYLFALVAGDLAVNRDSFVTGSGKIVELGIWVRAGDLARTDHAMHALKTAMAWDERAYGREYDLGVFNIVAVSDFNFGAMENKGLNIFNSRYILADPDTATDLDYDAIATVVAHEYFHNWSGNRVTCRDWFQLSLKEGFTVFRDQQYSADQGSAAVKRIEDVRVLRAAQFPEDGGPLAHPIRPNSYIEISNFYTATIYNKGAEVIRMLHTMLGEAAFRAGSDLYFDRHDGTAATCEDFIVAMEDASGRDLSRFRLWYSQAGTPRVHAALDHDAPGGRARLRLQQAVPATPGQPHKQAMPMPLRIALFGELSGTKLLPEQTVIFDGAHQEILFEGIGERPMLSINRGFSAPVTIESDRSAAELAFLSAHDDDPFARYEAMQQLMVDTLVEDVATGTADHAAVIAAVKATLADPGLEPAFVAEAVTLPSEAYLGDQMLVVDPQAVTRAWDRLRRALGETLIADWRGTHAGMAAAGHAYTSAGKGMRRLRGVALGYIVASGVEDGPALAAAHFAAADNMTDRQTGLSALAMTASAQRDAAFAAFHARYADNGLVLDKWFQTQALAPRDDTIDVVERLATHPDFVLTNPNRLRSLVGAFAINQRAFHDASGRGYRFLGDMVVTMDRLNPQTAAKLVPPLGRWSRFEPVRSGMMRAELERVLATPGLSKDVFEQVSKSLG
ncbi:aminopeptidase N [Sphingomonas montana]|uniref:aminopeptidase N n=1 Tax=Sphingomonas montana TaxID=1843236 RepID=UPI00096C6278|nr:aminopeptidase N [Sphingomonas montana]